MYSQCLSHRLHALGPSTRLVIPRLEAVLEDPPQRFAVSFAHCLVPIVHFFELETRKDALLHDPVGGMP